MATKRFDDVAEKARALEAQAKKLRREAQAARTKAYADALVAVFPEVKDMGSADEVLDFVKGLLAEVAEFEHPVLGSDAELAESLDVRIVQAVHSADGEARQMIYYVI